jgi:hypothetical protein
VSVIVEAYKDMKDMKDMKILKQGLLAFWGGAVVCRSFFDQFS